MKKIGTLIIIFSVLAFLTGCAPMTVSPTSYDSVVVGKNNPDTDIKAVQNAVDQGGTILLKGTFDFGNKGSVKIKNDISILGETGISGAGRVAFHLAKRGVKITGVDLRKTFLKRANEKFRSAAGE